MPEIPDEDAPIIGKKRSASESIDIHNEKSNNNNKRTK
jgi:hypothetical protein